MILPLFSECELTNSRSRSLYAIAVPSVVCHLSVVCNVHAPYARLKFSAICLRRLVPWLSISIDIHGKIYGDRPRKSSPSGEGLNARGVAKYSYFWNLECCISETV